MSISEEQKLAEWLEGNHNHPVDNDILEAVFILRPDLAPDPLVNLDEIIKSVRKGPFCTQDFVEDAQEDQKFVESIFSTSESMPAVTIDDVLQSISSGPLVPEEKADETNVVIRPWWKQPGVGIAAAAAVALIILLPTNFEGPPDQPEKEMLEYKEDSVHVHHNEAPVTPSSSSNELDSTGSSVSKQETSQAKTARKSPKKGKKSSRISARQPSVAVKRNTEKERMKPESGVLAPAPDPIVSDSETSQTVGGADFSSQNDALEASDSIEEVDKQIWSRRSSTSDNAVKENGIQYKERTEIDFESIDIDTTVMPSESVKTPSKWFGSLNNTLSRSQKRKLQAAGIEEIEELCRTATATEALDILWQKSMSLGTGEAIQVLLLSKQYEYGNNRYLARNYHRLGELYQSQGNSVQSERYYQLSMSLR